MEESIPENERIHVIVEGFVQGVGFRYFVQKNALALNLVGWVRNRWNQTVELVAEGNKKNLEQLLQALRRGPRSSTVSNLKIDWKPATGEFSGFHIRSTQ